MSCLLEYLRCGSELTTYRVCRVLHMLDVAVHPPSARLLEKPSPASLILSVRLITSVCIPSLLLLLQERSQAITMVVAYRCGRCDAPTFILALRQVGQRPRRPKLVPYLLLTLPEFLERVLHLTPVLARIFLHF